MLPRIQLPSPHPGQKQVRNEARRFNWLAAGRRWRKTTLTMAVAVQEAHLNDKSIIWGAPTYDQVRVGWEETKRAAASVAKFNQSVMLAVFPDGGSIRYRSLDDPDNARGWTADGVVIDESADIADSAYHEVLRPMLLDTGGWLWAIGTPKGRNWFWREFVLASERDDSRAWNAPTLGCRIVDGKLIRDPHPLENPNISFEEMQQLHRSLPERVFRQEILGEFIQESGGVFRKVLEAIDVDRAANEPFVDDGRSYVMGVDLARVEDFTVAVVLDESGRQVYFDRFNQISWERQTAAIQQAAQAYDAEVWLDSTGVGDPIFELLRKRGVRVNPYGFTNASKEALIDALAIRLENGGLRLMDLSEQTNELLAYEYELTPSRKVRMNAPAGMHDDCCIALALASWGLEDGSSRQATWGASPWEGQRW